jgi:hypothetical protein
MAGRANGSRPQPPARRAWGHWRAMELGAAALLAVAGGSTPGAAQVGYEPAHSPYRDMPGGAVWFLGVGYLGGGRGVVGVGPADGITGSARYEVSFGAVGASLGLAYARPTRFVRTLDSTWHQTGPFPTQLALADAGLQLVLTGRKTWRRLAPFVGAALGLAVGSDVPHDSSSYRFGTKLTLAPNAGLRWYPARRVSVRTDVRLLLWRLHYPLSYKQPGVDSVRVLAPGAPLDQWTAHPWVTIGVGWTF